MHEFRIGDLAYQDYELARECPADEVQRALIEAHLDPRGLIEKTKASALAVDDYVTEFISLADLAPEKLRHRLGLCGLMGGVPLIIALVTAALLYKGVIVDENSQRLAYVVMVGGFVTVILAVVFAIHVTVEAYVHQWVTRRALIDERKVFTNAINDLTMTNKPVATIVISHLSLYGKLSRVVAELTH